MLVASTESFPLTPYFIEVNNEYITDPEPFQNHPQRVIKGFFVSHELPIFDVVE